MANKTISARQRQKYDTSTNWASKNPVLLAGELGIESDTKKMKVGDGVTNWNTLDYISVDLSGYIQFVDVINNLTSTSTTAPLSAYQGNVLKGLVDTINSTLSTETTNR